jgi:hypothetical protein
MESDLSGVPCLALPFVSLWLAIRVFFPFRGIPVCSGGRVVVAASSPFFFFFLGPFVGASIPCLCIFLSGMCCCGSVPFLLCNYVPCRISVWQGPCFFLGAVVDGLHSAPIPVWSHVLLLLCSFSAMQLCALSWGRS